MKHLILGAGLVLFSSFLYAAQVEVSAVPEADSPAPTVQLAPASPLAPEALPDFMTPAPEDRSTYITWSGGTCTAWLFCPGEPYWKCQSTSGNCQHTGCAITCNGITRRCPASSNCIEF